MNGCRWLMSLVLLACFQAGVGHATDASREMVSRYVGTWDLDALLLEPSVRQDLLRLVGDDWDKLVFNLNVRGPIGFHGGAIAVMGNAPHGGGEEEAILCVQPGISDQGVHAAILSNGSVIIYSDQERYTFLTVCIRDWVALVSTRHWYRMNKPEHVRLIAPAPQ